MRYAVLNSSSRLLQESYLRFLTGVVAVFVIIDVSSLNDLVHLYRAKQLQPNGYHLAFLKKALSSNAFPHLYQSFRVFLFPVTMLTR